MPQEGRTALHWAAWMGQSEVVNVLLSAGADVNSETKAGTCAYANSTGVTATSACINIVCL